MKHLNRVLYILLLIFSAGEAYAQRSIITTAAGDGSAGFAGDGGPATGAHLSGPADVAVDAAGNIYIADRDNNRIRKVSAGSGLITTIAGNGTPGLEGDNGPATSASITMPWGVAVDGAGNVYITDFQNGRIRKVSAGTGIITTVEVMEFFPNETLPGARDPFWRRVQNLQGIKFFKDGYALPVDLSGPVGIAVDSAGNLYVAEQAGHRISKVAADTGFITTLAGTGAPGFSGDGGRATAAQLHNPTDVAIDSAGNIYFSDSSNNRIRRISAGGIISTVVGQLNRPAGVAVDSGGNVWIADTFSQQVRRATAGGTPSTIAGGGNTGDGCAAATSFLDSPLSLAVNRSGNLIYVADQGGQRIRLVTLDATTSAPAVSSISPPGGAAGKSTTVTLAGSGFASTCRGIVVSAGGAGVTVTGVNIASDTSMSATFIVAADAALGARPVTVTTESGTSAPSPFTVLPGPPTLTSITPPDVVRGSSATVTLTGTNFDTRAGSTTVSAADAGIAISDVRVASPTSLTATLTLPADATLGDHTLSVATEEGPSNAVPIVVLPQSPTLVYEMPKLLNPTQQTPIQLALAAPGGEPVTGELTLTFVPNASTSTDDPNVTFINSQTNARSATVTFPVNVAKGQVSIPNGVLQAGTVAGTIRLSMTDVQVAGMNVTPAGSTFDIEVPRLVPVITNVRILNRSAAGFDVEVTGYSTSREIAAATFDFSEAKGAHLLTLHVQPEVVSSFTTYYQSGPSSVVGGAFVYVQPFTVQQGDVNAVGSVTVTLSNAQGPSQAKTARIKE